MIVDIGLLAWQIALIAIGICLLIFLIAFLVAMFICKLGMPKYKPWEQNKQFYSKQDQEMASTDRGLVKSSGNETYKDQYQSTNYNMDENPKFN